MTKVFSKALMMSEDVQSYVGSTRFYESEAPAEIFDGAFVVLGDLDADKVYGGGAVDYNVYKSSAPTADNQVMVVVDIAGISEGVIAGNTYKIGNKLVDLKAQAGFPVRFRRLALGDKFWLGEGNFVEAPNGRAYATCTGGSMLLNPTSDMPYGGKFGVKIVATQDLVVGQTVAKNSADKYEQLYLCEVISLRS